MLYEHDDQAQYKKDQTYIKYSEDKEEELTGRLSNLDKPLYRMLNPELERI